MGPMEASCVLIVTLYHWFLEMERRFIPVVLRVQVREAVAAL